MKKALIKLLSSTLALTLVLAVSGAGNAQMNKVQAEGTRSARTVAITEEAVEEKVGTGIIEALEEKMKEEIPVVQSVKAEAPVAAQKAEAEKVAAPEIKAVAAEEAVIPEAPTAEPTAEWNVSATASDRVAMTFYADAKAEAGQVAVDAQNGVVYISGTGAMEESVYRHFMSTEKYIATIKALFETSLGVTVDPVYDENITDVLELDANIRFYNHETKEEIFVTEDMRMQLNSTDFLAYSPTAIYVNEGITNVSDFAFVCCGDLEEVLLPSTVESIGTQAFQYCGNLRRVVLPEIAEIKAGAFEYCHNLETVELAGDAYYNSKIKNPTDANAAQPDAVWNVSATEADNVSMAFYAEKTSQVELDVQSGVVYINGTGAMEEAVYTNFMSVDKYLTAVRALFKSVRGIDVDFDYDETITDVLELDASIHITDRATGERVYITDDIQESLNPTDFLAYSPTAIYISEGITSVSDFAFACCGDITEVVLPSTVEKVGAQAFAYCNSLKKVVLPKTAEVATDAFVFCDNLEVIELADETSYNNNAAVRTLTAEEVHALVY